MFFGSLQCQTDCAQRQLRSDDRQLVRTAATGAMTSVCGTSRELFRLHSIIGQVGPVTFEAKYISVSLNLAHCKVCLTPGVFTVVNLEPDEICTT